MREIQYLQVIEYASLLQNGQGAFWKLDQILPNIECDQGLLYLPEEYPGRIIKEDILQPGNGVFFPLLVISVWFGKAFDKAFVE